MNLIELIPMAAILMMAIITFLVFHQTLGSVMTMMGKIVSLAVISFLGWFIIDYTS